MSANVTMEQVRAMDDRELRRLVAELSGQELWLAPHWPTDLNAAIALMPDDPNVDWELTNYADHQVGVQIKWKPWLGYQEVQPRGQEARAVTLAWVAWRLQERPTP